MKSFLLPLMPLLLLASAATAMASEHNDGIIGNLQLGMTEAEVNEQYPEGKRKKHGQP